MNLHLHGVQRRMISVDNFFVFLRLLFFAVLLLYAEKCKIRGISSDLLDQLAQIKPCRISTGTAWRGANQFDNVEPHHRYRLT